MMIPQMEMYGRGDARAGPDHPPGHEPGLEDPMRQLRLWSWELYPERPGMVDCTYYMRTGTCGYGNKCRYNHPRDRSSSVGGAAMIGGSEYPERPGEPTCQYYLRTGTCKFGSSCKFHHPRNAGGSLSNVPLNTSGYPLRPGEIECSYYLRTGQCKFGITCKFHHPQLAGVSMPASAPPFLSTVQTLQSPSAPAPEQHAVASSSYRAARPPLVPSSYVPGAYGHVILSPGMVPIPNWNPYSAPVSPSLSPGAQPSIGAASLYGMTSTSPAFPGPYPTLLPSGGPSSTNQIGKIFPERPGQLECQYYLKTGDCKFGLSCKFHHPRNWVATQANCVLSSLGLPLRPGVQACVFYLRTGQCKFGRTCKFDHPMTAVRYSPSASSLTDIPVAPYVYGSSVSLATVAPSVSRSDLRPEFISRSLMSSSVGLIYPQTGSIDQLSSQSSPLIYSRSTRQGEVLH